MEPIFEVIHFDESSERAIREAEEATPISMMPELTPLQQAEIMSKYAPSPEHGSTSAPGPVSEEPEIVGDDVPNELKEGQYRAVDEDMIKYYPYAASGTLRAQITNTNTASCGSGSAVAPRIVITAAHVIHGGKGSQEYTPVWFTPGHPFEAQKFFAERAYIMCEWATTGDFVWDVALLYLRDSLSLPGYHGLKAGVPLHRAAPVYGWWTIAYPFAPPFYNQKQQIADGGRPSDRAFQNGNVYWQYLTEAWEGYDLTKGAGGGPWLIYNKNLGRNILPGSRTTSGATVHFVNGVNSYTVSGKNNIIYSPQFWIQHEIFFRDVIAHIVVNP
jgi:hypothetical protein